jgi:acetyl esterase
MTARLDPQVADLLAVMRAAGQAPLHTLGVEEARARLRAAHASPREPLALRSVDDMVVPTESGPLPVRVYRPRDGVLPVALFLHGGGWMLNDLDTHDDLCRRLALRSGWLLVAVDYRRAPEHPHPAAVDDARAAYRWTLAEAGALGADPSWRALVGESSGATTAAALALLLRDEDAPAPSLQVLAYPMMDVVGRWPSHVEHGTGYSLDGAQCQWFFESYVPAGWDLDDPYLFPLAADDLSGLPPAVVLTAEFDPLRDEGAAYADKLARHGVSVTHVHADDQMHGFLLLSRVVDRAARLVEQVADALAVNWRGAVHALDQGGPS